MSHKALRTWATLLFCTTNTACFHDNCADGTCSDVAAVADGADAIDAHEATDIKPDVPIAIPPGPFAHLHENLRIDLTKNLIVLNNGTHDMYTIDLTKLRFGKVTPFDADFNYNPVNLADNPPVGLKWLHVVTAKFVQYTLPAPTLGFAPFDGVAIELKLGDDKGVPSPDYPTYTLVLSAQQADAPNSLTFRADLRLQDAVLAKQMWGDQAKSPITYTDLAIGVSSTERFYGMGERMDSPQVRGKIVQMQLALTDLDGSSNEAHVPIPLLIGTHGWGLFVESRRPAIFDVAATHNDEVHAVFNAPELTFWLLAHDDAVDVTGLYTRLTGAPVLPAWWAFGSLIWRNENKDTAEVLEDLLQIRKNDLAFSGMWLDRPFDVHVNDFGFDPLKFAKPSALINALHLGGLRVGEWSTPYVEKGAREHDKVVANKWYVQTPPEADFLFKWGPPLDFTIPAVTEFWKSQIKLAADAGIEGWKLDYGEDIQLGFADLRLHYKFFDGSDERTMHHGYAPLYHRPYAESLPKTGGWLLNRGGTYGDQVYTSIVWPGDLCANWAEYGDCDTINGKTTCHAGGLPASVSAGISLAASGYPLFGPDTGGYRHGRASKELFLRWLQHSAMLGILQIGGGIQHNPWDFAKYEGNQYGVSQFDQEVLDTARYYIRLHTRLFPTIYTYAQRAHDHLPGLIRGLGLMHPELDTFPNIEYFEKTEYYFGDWLLIAPMTQPGGKRKVLLPKGIWIDWWTHQPVGLPDQATVIDVQLPVTQGPMYVRPGAILPMLRETVQSLADPGAATLLGFASPDPAVSIWHDTKMTIVVVPGGGTSLNLSPTDSVGQSFSSQRLLTVRRQSTSTSGGESAQTDGGPQIEWEVWTATKPDFVGRSLRVGPIFIESSLAKSTAQSWPTCSKCWFFDESSGILRMRGSGANEILQVTLP